MKFIQLSVRAVANLGIAVLIGGLFNLYQEGKFTNYPAMIEQGEPVASAAELHQEFPSARAVYPPIQPALKFQQFFPPKLVSQLGSRVDLPLLAKVGAAFTQSDRYQTESEIEVQATSGSTNVTSSAKAVTVVQSPNQFHSEITFSQPKSSSKAAAL